LRTIPFIAALNSKVKAHQLRAGLKRLAAYYKSQAEKRSFQYQEQAAIDEFRRRQLNLNPDHSPKKTGYLRIFWWTKWTSRIIQICIFTEKWIE
jgi:hypothetical protein